MFGGILAVVCKEWQDNRMMVTGNDGSNGRYYVPGGCRKIR